MDRYGFDAKTEKTLMVGKKNYEDEIGLQRMETFNENKQSSEYPAAFMRQPTGKSTNKIQNYLDNLAKRN